MIDRLVHISLVFFCRVVVCLCSIIILTLGLGFGRHARTQLIGKPHVMMHVFASLMLSRVVVVVVQNQRSCVRQDFRVVLLYLSRVGLLGWCLCW